MTRRAAWTALSAAAVALIALSAAKPWQPALLWNATASTPIGLYRLHAPGILHDGELVAAMPPPRIASFLARGGFLPRGVPLLKHIAALPGQTACRMGDIVTVDGKTVGLALDRDHLGRLVAGGRRVGLKGPVREALHHPVLRGAHDARIAGRARRQVREARVLRLRGQGEGQRPGRCMASPLGTRSWPARPGRGRVPGADQPDA